MGVTRGHRGVRAVGIIRDIAECGQWKVCRGRGVSKWSSAVGVFERHHGVRSVGALDGQSGIGQWELSEVTVE